MYTATTVKILRPGGDTETYTLSMGGGEPTIAMRNLYNLIQQYIDGSCHEIDGIKKVQAFLVCSGYGLTNIILLEASPLHIVDDGYTRP